MGFSAPGLDFPLRRRTAGGRLRAAAFSAPPTAAATWTEITPEATKGLPPKPYGRIAVAIAPSNPKRLCFRRIDRSPLFVSDDGGATWDRRDKSQWMVWRPFYFANLIVDPKDRTAYSRPTAPDFQRGRRQELRAVGGFNGAHGDFHDVWIDPNKSQHVITGDDGGLWYSYDGANKWWKPRICRSRSSITSASIRHPYHVYGGLQDNSSWSAIGVSRRHHEAAVGKYVRRRRFLDVCRSGGSRLRLCRIAGRYIGRVNRNTHESRAFKPQPNYKEKLRFNWNTPIALSPNEKGNVYIGSQFLFRSRTTARPGNAFRRT